MNKRTKRNILFFIVWPLGGFGIILLGFMHEALALLLFPFLLIVGYIGKEVRCDHCGTPVGWHLYKMPGFSFWSWSPFTPKKCETCGHDIE